NPQNKTPSPASRFSGPLPVLPDLHPHLAIAHHRLAGLAAERLRKCRHVRWRADRAILRRRMRIGVQAYFLRLGQDAAGPDTSEGDEEALVLGVAVDFPVGFGRIL